ncbi:MAG: secretion system protein E [Desulfuromonadales bacterium C00003096]|nr:MAG: secretion system protein E [Desulfuromonadales bacterium C00003096]
MMGRIDELVRRMGGIVHRDERLYEIAPYNTEKDGKLIDDSISDGYKEIERYWVYEPYASILILCDIASKMPVYYIAEPVLTLFEKTILERLYDDLSDVLTLSDIEIDENVDKNKILQKKALELLEYYSMTLQPQSLYKILYFLERNFIGYGKLDAMMKDPHIEDVSCDGYGIPIFLYHTKYTNIATNISFDEKPLNSFVVGLVQRCGKHVSMGNPMVNATLPDGSRLQATLGREVTTRGSSFTVRRFRDDPFTPVDLLNFKTCSIEILAYLWLAIENNKSMIVAGGTASGKTSTLNAISMFIPPMAKIVSIEDTRELMLHHENWIASVTKDAIVAQEGIGEVGMFELLRAALRQRPEYILVGEVRGAEALTLFQAMSTGHATYSTMHAADIGTMINRLHGEPINVPHAMMQALDIVAIQVQTYIGQERVRRTKEIIEITGLDPRTGTIKANSVFRWDPVTDDFKHSGDSSMLHTIAEERGWTEKELFDALVERVEVLEYLVKNNVSNYREISRMVQRYLIDSDAVLSEVRGETLTL